MPAWSRGRDARGGSSRFGHAPAGKPRALPRICKQEVRLDEALADKNWTAATEQTGAYQDLPPAIIMDVDETAIDNLAYEAGLITSNSDFNPKTWTMWANAAEAKAIPGPSSLRSMRIQEVKVFFVTNRTKEEEEGTRKKTWKRSSFPMGGNVDTFLTNREQEGWTSAKGTRRAFVAKDYRVLLLIGDNFGDFSDAYRTSEEERMKAFEEAKARWGHDWLMLPNPTYGSFEFRRLQPRLQDPRRRAPQDEDRRALQTWTARRAIAGVRQAVAERPFHAVCLVLELDTFLRGGIQHSFSPVLPCTSRASPRL